MTKEEIYIDSKLRHKQPFAVPDGYFEQLTDRVMSRLPEEVQIASSTPRVAILRRLRPVLYAAACLCLFVVGISFYFANSHDAEQQPMLSQNVSDVLPAGVKTADAGTADDDYIDEAADYCMMDNYDIYACLAYDAN